MAIHQQLLRSYTLGTFENSLANFINDAASGDAVRHLADCGFTVTEIAVRLSFPTEKKRVSEMVWKHYIETGRISLTEPAGESLRKVSYVKDEGPYGRVSMRQVVTEIPAPEQPYIRCDFGRRLYAGRERFLQELEKLDKGDREYILDLPWPLTDVWHIADERMARIAEALL